jgi:hypothetical protein
MDNRELKTVLSADCAIACLFILAIIVALASLIQSFR